MPYSAATAVMCSGLGTSTDAGGSVSVLAGSDNARTKSANGAGSVTIRKRASLEVTRNVCGTSRGPYTNEPAGATNNSAAYIAGAALSVTTV
jgi:hypothetical protein